MVDIRTDRRGGRRWRPMAVAPVGVAALVSLAACGTSTSADTSAASSGSTPTSAAGGSTAQDPRRRGPGDGGVPQLPGGERRHAARAAGRRERWRPSATG